MLSNNLAALYIRVSTPDQALFGFSEQAQNDSLKDYCKSNDWSIYNTYIDSGISGKSASNRPALQQLLQDGKKGNFQTVVVWKLNRLARNVVDLLEIIDQFKAHNIRLKSMTEQFDLETPLGQFTLQMLSSVSELERKTIAENVKMGRIQKTKSGYYCNAAVLGYRSETLEYHSRRRKTTTLSIDPDEANIVRKIYQLYSQGYGLKAICNHLNKQGVPSKHGNSFSITTIRQTLNNVMYIGKLRYFDSQARKDVIVDGVNEPIIPLSLWEKVQSRKRNNSVTTKKKWNRFFPLTTLLKCPQCGSSMIAFHMKQERKNGPAVHYYYYICNQYQNKGLAACRANMVPATEIENIVLENLHNLILQHELLKDIVKNINNKSFEEQLPLQERLATILKDLQSIENKKKKYFNLFEEDIIDKSTFIQKMEALKQKQQKLTVGKSTIEEKLNAQLNPTVSYTEVQNTLKEFLTLWPKLAQDKQKLLMHSMIECITLSSNKSLESVQIHFNPSFLPYTLTEPTQNKIHEEEIS